MRRRGVNRNALDAPAALPGDIQQSVGQFVRGAAKGMLRLDLGVAQAPGDPIA